MINQNGDRNSAQAPRQPFDPNDKDSYDFGDLSRQEANEILLYEESGVFLIRSSSTKKGDLVLCVLEDKLVSHYIIHFVDNEEKKWHIGTAKFANIPAILSHYSVKVLKSSTLIRPAKHLQYITKSHYLRRNPQELNFDKGIILTLLQRHSKQFFRMKNENGEIGFVNAQLVDKYDPNEHYMLRKTSVTQSSIQIITTARHCRKLPASAVVKRNRIPNAYDSSALRLNVGEKLQVIAINDDGMWDGELENTKQRGKFPFTHIDFVETKTTLRPERLVASELRRSTISTSST